MQFASVLNKSNLCAIGIYMTTDNLIRGRISKIDSSRTGILNRLREKIARGEPIIGGGAGTGLSAKAEEAGGIDLIIIYNSGRFRMAGRGSAGGPLPYGKST